MKPITKIMVDEYHMKYFDWMGYKVSRSNPFSFHHLYIPARFGGKYERNNGAILACKTAHPYLHSIECMDKVRFEYIQDILKEVNVQGYITTLDQYRRIDSCLQSFEREYSGARTSKNKLFIREEYTRRIM